VIEIIEAPFDLCGKHVGSRLGPTAMHLEGLTKHLSLIGQNVHIGPRVWALNDQLPEDRSVRAAQAVECYRSLKHEVARSIRDGRTPMVIGGDHSISIGSISGALSEFGPRLAVLWIDAHMDLNLPAQSPSGNMHGMPLAALTRMEDHTPGPLNDVWRVIQTEIVPKPGLTADRLGWLGLRDVDRGEAENIQRLDNPLCLTMQDVDLLGVTGCISHVEQWLKKSGATALWLSFDVDSLDPIFAPGTGTAVRGGFTYREGHLIAELFHRMFKQGPISLAGFDVVEVNPLRDRENETAKVAVEWVSSLFGKTILHGNHPGRTEG
jgi:arginase